MRRSRLAEVVRVFGWLGMVGFGGPAAHIALMRRELVERRRWEDEQTFVDLVGLTSLLPGPNSTELAIELGRRRAGGIGLVLAGVAFITPAAVAVGLLAWAYTDNADTAALDDLRYGILPVVVAVIASATVQLARTAASTLGCALVAIAAFAGFLVGVNELLLLAAGAAALGLWGNRRRLPGSARLILHPGIALAASSAPIAGELGLVQIFWSFVRIGGLLFGSGYVIAAFLEAEFVDRLGVLTPEQVLDAVAVGQLTPGPVFTVATFVGYLLAGPAGAVVATVAVFLPAFVLVAALGRFVGPVVRSPVARPVLDGLNAAAVGLIGGAAVDLAGDGIIDPLTGVLAGASLVVLVTTKLNTSWVIAGGVVVGVAHAVT